MENDELRDEETLEEETSEEVEEEVQEDEESSEEESSDEDDKDWQAEAKKWEAIAKRNLKKKPKLETKAKKPEDEDLTARLSTLETSEKKRRFGYEYGLSPEETDKIFQIEPNPTEATLKDPFVKAGLEAVRRQRRVEDNTPSSSAKSNPTTSKKFKDLSPAEKNAEWQKYMKSKNVLK